MVCLEGFVEYKILICDDNEHYIERLRQEISTINYKNKSYQLSITTVSSPQIYVDKVKTGGYDVIILDACIKNAIKDPVVFDYLRNRMHQDYYGPDLYVYAKKYCPNALTFVLSNLPVVVSRTEFNNVDAEYFCKTTTPPCTIANYIKNYFDTQKKRLLNNVFVVYGHNEDMRTAVTKYIKRIGIRSLDLMEYSPSGIKTIFDSLNSCANLIECAVILLSADDIVVNDKFEFQSYRARQNVIFEMGFFAGILGKDKVIVVYEPNENFEFPSDIVGVYYTAYEKDNKWKQDLRLNLKKIGFQLD